MVKMEDLQRFSIWKSIPENLLQAILPYIVRQKVSKGTHVVREGEEGEMVYFIEEGLFRVSYESEDREVILNHLGPGDFFGEQALLRNQRTADVWALETGSLLVIHRRDLLHLIRKYPEVALSIIAALLQRLKATNQHLAYLAAWDAAGRVARALSDLCEDLGEPFDEGILIPRRRLSVQDLAKYVGLTRETTSRALRILESERVLRILKEGIWLPQEGEQ